MANPRSAPSFIRFVSVTTISFFIGAPAMTYVLLALKGLTAFAAPHRIEMMAWVFHVTWMSALMTGLSVSMIIWKIVSGTGFFTQPYDFGRCFSLGAIIGACAEAFWTWMYGRVAHRPFSNFWIAGATIVGCLVGSLTTAVVLARSKNYQPKVPLV